MYCKKCKTILKDHEATCQNCNFDNTQAYDYMNDLEKMLNEQKKNKRDKKPIIPIISLLFLLFFGLTCLYLIKDTKAASEIKKIPITTTKKIAKTHKFNFENISLTYPEIFGSSKNTIFYKNNSAININIRTIDANEYTNIINGNDCLESKIGNLDTQTFAGNNYYSYLFIYKELYYDITVNYINDTTIYTEDIGNIISNIINSIELK